MLFGWGQGEMKTKRIAVSEAEVLDAVGCPMVMELDGLYRVADAVTASGGPIRSGRFEQPTCSGVVNAVTGRDPGR